MLAVSRQFWATPLPRREERILTFLSPESLGLRLPLLLRADQGSCSLNLAVDARSHHPSLRYVLPQLLLRTPRSSGRQAAYSSGRVSVLRPQNDSGSPAKRPCIVARNSSPRATSGTTAWPAC